MPTYRDALPQTLGRLDAHRLGDRDRVIFGAGRELPGFALFPLLAEDEGRAILERYYREHLDVAATYGLGYVLETPTWRSNPE